MIFPNHNKNYIELSDGDILTYFISEPMFMRGVEIFQVSVVPFYERPNSNEYIFYDEINLNVDILELDESESLYLSKEFDLIVDPKKMIKGD